MKSLLLSLILCISIGNLYAQHASEKKPNYYKQGERMLSISPNISWRSIIRSRDGIIIGGGLSIGSDVAYGKFIKDKWMVGSRLSYFSQINFETPTSYHQLGFQTFTRYYFGRGRWTPFVEGGVGLKDHYYTSTKTHNIEAYAYGRVGLAYRPTKRFSLEVSAGYKYGFGPVWSRNHGIRPKLGINFHF